MSQISNHFVLSLNVSEIKTIDASRWECVINYSAVISSDDPTPIPETLAQSHRGGWQSKKKVIIIISII